MPGGGGHFFLLFLLFLYPRARVVASRVEKLFPVSMRSRDLAAARGLDPSNVRSLGMNLC